MYDLLVPIVVTVVAALIGSLMLWWSTRRTQILSSSVPHQHSQTHKTIVHRRPTNDEHSLPTLTLGSTTPTKNADLCSSPSPTMKDASCQNDDGESTPLWMTQSLSGLKAKPDAQLLEMLAEKRVNECTTADVLRLLALGAVKAAHLEKLLGNELKAVHTRREHLAPGQLTDLPYTHMDYSYVSNTCCENVIGYIPIPCGYAGPLLVNGSPVNVPLATTEGCLVASINRGCAAILRGGHGVTSTVLKDGMTRAPLVAFPTVDEALECMAWMLMPDNVRRVKQTFESTSRFAKLLDIKIEPVGAKLYMRFVASTGDAMGMNMISKGVDVVLTWMLTEHFPHMRVLSVSSNYCTDKKHASLNWTEGRGKSVTSTCVIDASTVQSVLKTNVDAMVDLCHDKCQVGSALAGGDAGSQNCHAANIVTAIFIATGQDPAQNVSSSMCQTTMERTDNGDLRVTCLMKCIEVGTVGGGTILPAQRSALEMMGIAGGDRVVYAGNAKRLAQIVCATVLAGEVNLMAALTSGDLVRSHMIHNRSNMNLLSVSSAPSRKSSVAVTSRPSSPAVDTLRSVKFQLASSPDLSDVHKTCNQAML